MDPIRALFELFRLGARFGEVRNRLAQAAQKGLIIVTLISLAVSAASVALCLLAYALERELARYLGEIGSPLLLAFLLIGVVVALYLTAHKMIKVPPPPVPVAKNPEEMSNAALLALLGGIVVGTVLQARKDNKE